jgi:GntR family transcriptional repressor for pyruvate dehydrogenase complex
LSERRSGLTQDGALRRTLGEHHAILAGRQADVAHALTTVHVAGVEQWLRKAL